MYRWISVKFTCFDSLKYLLCDYKANCCYFCFIWMKRNVWKFYFQKLQKKIEIFLKPETLKYTRITAIGFDVFIIYFRIAVGLLKLYISNLLKNCESLINHSIGCFKMIYFTFIADLNLESMSNFLNKFISFYLICYSLFYDFCTRFQHERKKLCGRTMTRIWFL